MGFFLFLRFFKQAQVQNRSYLNLGIAMKLLAFLLCFTGSLLVYCSHSNQNLLKQSLTKAFYYLGVFLVVLALPIFLLQLPKLVAVFMWLMTMLVVWSFIPFIPLFNRYLPHEVSKSAKDTA